MSETAAFETENETVFLACTPSKCVVFNPVGIAVLLGGTFTCFSVAVVVVVVVVLVLPAQMI